MVVGSGLMAKAFAEYSNNDEVLIFASGVSNSKEIDPKAFERERLLLQNYLEKNRQATFVYFSTCSVYDPVERDSLYVRHKLESEQFVKEHSKQYLIFRVSNVAGHTSNKFTIFNFLAEHINTGIPFILWENAYRNIIDADDVAKFASYIIDHEEKNKIINLANIHTFSVATLVRLMEAHFRKKGMYTVVDKGSYFEIDTGYIKNLAGKAAVDFSEGYIERLLQKYY